LTVERLGDHTGDMEKFSLEARSRVLMNSAATAPAGRAAETGYGGHEHVLRQTLIALTAGAVLSEHENPGEATVQILGGRVRLVADATEWEGRDGDLLIVPQARHTLHALEDSAVSAYRRQTPVGVRQRLSSRCAVPVPTSGPDPLSTLQPRQPLNAEWCSTTDGQRLMASR
jgi:quercetin dioxygenase-like cupin family protein